MGEGFYKGSMSNFDSSYKNTAFTSSSGVGAYTDFGRLSVASDPRTANQVKATSEHLNTGAKSVEISTVGPDVFESIPDEYLKEINRMGKLTGTDVTFHAPMLDPVGLTDQGYSDLNREKAEKQLWSAIERAHEMKPDGNLNVTMHASTGGPPGVREEWVGEGKNRQKKQSMFIVSEDFKSGVEIKPERYKFEQMADKNWEFDMQKLAEEENKEVWNKQINEIRYYTDYLSNMGGVNNKEIELANLGPEDDPAHSAYNEYIKDIRSKENYKRSNLIRAYDSFKELFNSVEKWTDRRNNPLTPDEQKKMTEVAQKIYPLVNKLGSPEKNPEIVEKFSNALSEGVDFLENIKNPQPFVNLRDFAIDKSSDTISNLALKSYKTFKDTAPIISVENHPAYQSILTTGKDLKDVIDDSRKKFIEKAVQNGVSKKKAQKQAERLIGATWDVGHINMLKKFGYTDDDITNETKAIAKDVKHLHLSDNFGMDHTELPMGMGNVPYADMLAEIEKSQGGKFMGKKVIEAGNWWQHWSNQGKNHAIIPTLQGMDSSIYAMQNEPYWSQAADTPQSYFGFPSTYLPENHFSMYGTGFSSLPQELGGQIAGTNSRFTGAPNS